LTPLSHVAKLDAPTGSYSVSLLIQQREHAPCVAIAVRFLGHGRMIQQVVTATTAIMASKDRSAEEYMRDKLNAL
jgi:hypothetical protein